ncbi:MAG: hypothetical protein J7621_00005, partial [Niastella sp.]|nr:hypothetical protein [Niastella sp.]
MTQLMRDIKANRCILFLGPLMKAFKDDKTNEPASHAELYCRSLTEALQSNQITFDSDATNNPYYLATRLINGDTTKVATVSSLIEQIYDRPAYNIYKDLAIIPFNTIINFGFDHAMKKAMD